MEIMRPLPGVHSSKWSRIQLKIEEHRCYNHATISMFISMILVFICCCCSARSLVLAHSDAGSEAWTCVVVGARSCTELNVEKYVAMTASIQPKMRSVPSFFYDDGFKARNLHGRYNAQQQPCGGSPVFHGTVPLVAMKSANWSEAIQKQ